MSRDRTRDQFEQKTRARRAAACVRAARRAIAEGRFADAAERLDEACRLDPDAIEPRVLLDGLRAESADTASSAPRQPARDGWDHWLAAGVAIFALAALAFLWPPDAGPSLEAPARRAGPEGPALARTVTTAVSTPTDASRSVVPPPVSTSGRANVGQRVEVRRRPLQDVGALRLVAVAAPAPQEGAPPATERDAAVREASAQTLDPPQATREGTKGEADEALVSATLRRYAEACSRLDVGAAREIWPTDDGLALSREFNGLEPREVTVERCDVRVTGQTASASCRVRAVAVRTAGTTEPPTSPSLWTFTLRKAEATWLIQSAEKR